MTDPDCIVGVHLDTGWDHPLGWAELVDHYIESTDAAFASLYEPMRQNDGYKDRHDADIYDISRGGEVPDGTVNEILDTGSAITVIGGYWQGCHRQTVVELAKGIAQRDGGEDYTIHLPSQYISGAIWTLAEMQHVYIEEGMEQYIEDTSQVIPSSSQYSLEPHPDMEEPPELWLELVTPDEERVDRRPRQHEKHDRTDKLYWQDRA